MESPGPTPTSLEASYLAGFVDGEGCFMAPSTIAVTNSFPGSLRRLQAAFGGTIRRLQPAPNARTRHQWYVTGDNARAAVLNLLPHLHEKHRQAQILLELITYPARSATRAALCRELTALKHVEYSNPTD